MKLIVRDGKLFKEEFTGNYVNTHEIRDVQSINMDRSAELQYVTVTVRIDQYVYRSEAIPNVVKVNENTMHPFIEDGSIENITSCERRLYQDSNHQLKEEIIFQFVIPLAGVENPLVVMLDNATPRTDAQFLSVQTQTEGRSPLYARLLSSENTVTVNTQQKKVDLIQRSSIQESLDIWDLL